MALATVVGGGDENLPYHELLKKVAADPDLDAQQELKWPSSSVCLTGEAYHDIYGFKEDVRLAELIFRLTAGNAAKHG